MKKTSLFLLMAILVLALVKPAAAEITLTVDQLKKMKIDPTSFSLANMSQDGKTLLGVEKIRDAKRKARGEVWQVKIFRIEGAAAKVDAVLLPTTQLEQMAISPDGKSALALSDFGTRFIAIDLEKKSARTLWKNEAGKPGFRSQPEVIWWEKGQFHTPGYFYDEAQAVTGDAIASVDVQGSGLSAIQSVRAIDGLRKRTAGFAVQQWFSSEQSYFAMLDAAERKMRLLATVGDDTLPIDAALGYGGIAVGQDRVIYAARWDKASAGVVVCDLGSKKRWKIGDAGKLYNYLYMSADGSNILVSHLDLSTGKMSTWYGREADNFTLRPVPGIEGVAPGTIRFSPSGNALAFYNEKGLLFQELP